MFAGTVLSVRLFVCAGLSLFIICGPYLSVVVCVLYAYNLTKEEEDETSELPLYNPAVSRKKDFIERPYNLRPRNRKTANSHAVLVSKCL